MCWIAFGKRPFLARTFWVQNERGEDGVGIVDATGSLLKCFLKLDNETWASESTDADGNEVGDNWDFHFFDKGGKPEKYYNKEKFYTDYLNYALPAFGKGGDDENLLLHHRKGSVGTKDIRNVHPYAGDTFMLLQNGTDHTFHNWGILEGFDETMSDSYMMLMFIEKHCTNLEEVAAVLDSIRDKVKFGVVVVTDKKGRLLVFSDGARSLTIAIDDDKKKVEWFRSMRDLRAEEEFFDGFLLMDFEGNVIEMKFTKLNFVKPKSYPVVTKPPVQIQAPFAHQGSVPKTVDDYMTVEEEEDLEEYYRALHGQRSDTKQTSLNVPVNTDVETGPGKVFFESYWQNGEVDEMSTALSRKLVDQAEWTTLDYFNYNEEWNRFRIVSERRINICVTRCIQMNLMNHPSYKEELAQVRRFIWSLNGEAEL